MPRPLSSPARRRRPVRPAGRARVRRAAPGRDADRVDRPREEAADEVGAADQQRRRDGQDGRHARYPRTPVTTADRVTAAGDLRRCDDGRDRPAEAELVERYRSDPLLHPGDRVQSSLPTARSRPSTSTAEFRRRTQARRTMRAAVARGTRAALPAPRRSSAARRSGAPSRRRRAGRGRVASRGAQRAARRCGARRARARAREPRSSRHLVHEPDPQRRGRVESLARDEVPPRGALADLSERERRDHGRDDPELHLGEGEDRSRGSAIDDVAACDEPDAAAERVALDDARRPVPGSASIASNIRRSAFASATFSSRSRSAEARIHSTSAPAQKLGPSPARTTARARAHVDERLGELGDQRRRRRRSASPAARA